MRDEKHFKGAHTHGINKYYANLRGHCNNEIIIHQEFTKCSAPREIAIVYVCVQNLLNFHRH